MQWCKISGVLGLLFAFISANRFLEVQRKDGSYSIGVESNSLGGTADSVAALVTKASGWTERTGLGRAGLSADFNVDVPSAFSTGVQVVKQVPYLEILRLVEAFLKLKGELGGRFWALLSDNAHILAALRDTFIGKISTLHSFTLGAIVILRKILEFASSLFGNVNFSGGVAFG